MTGRLIKADVGGEVLLTFSIEEKAQAVYTAEKFDSETLLDIEIKKHRKKRSLNANAYFHLLCREIAHVNSVSDTAQKNLLISRYGAYETTEDGIVDIALDDSIDFLELEWVHLEPTQIVAEDENGRLYRKYLVMRGSHTYDTAEMSRLIDGTVDEAKELGIETKSPEEIRRMVELWKGECVG